MPDAAPAQAPSSVLECHGLRKSFGDRVAVDDVGFRIGPSETYGLLGPNGAGKTTTISMICGLLVRDAGTVVVAGRPVDIDEADAEAAIGYVPRSSRSIRTSPPARTFASSASSTGCAMPS
jgi:ABC-2 type transport system ATP-binding protein